MNYDCDFGELWIVLDSRSALQHFSDWPSVNDEASVSIQVKPRMISQIHDVHLQRIPSQVNIRGNEIPDRLAIKRVVRNKTATGISFTYQELYFNGRSKLNLIWRVPPTHQCYTGTSPGSLLEIKCDRGFQIAQAHHLNCLSFESGRKINPTLVRNAVAIQLHRITF
ncbi:RNase H domain-containing protein [Trichonephila clavipes]|nr:RNase H domain-containing protein [Trichonephila clavipes]